MTDLNELYHYREEVFIYDQLNPDEQLMYRRYPARQPSTLSLKMASVDKCPDRPTVDEAEQERKEDEFLKRSGV